MSRKIGNRLQFRHWTQNVFRVVSKQSIGTAPSPSCDENYQVPVLPLDGGGLRWGWTWYGPPSPPPSPSRGEGDNCSLMSGVLDLLSESQGNRESYG